MKTYKITLTKPNAFFLLLLVIVLMNFLFAFLLFIRLFQKKCFLKSAKFVKLLALEVFIFHLTENLLLLFFNFIN